VDCLGILFAKSPYRPIEAETARTLAVARQEYGKPIVVVWVGNTQASYLEGPASSALQESGRELAEGQGLPANDGVDDPVSAIDVLREAGIPVFFQARDAVYALSRVVAYREFRSGWQSGQGGKHASL
jgi:acyl-CoA synthetase (NDP forming)